MEPREPELFQFVRRLLEDEGYTVIRDPDPSILPSELKSLRPDAVALGEPHNLVIRIKTQEGEGKQESEEVMDFVPDWRVRTYFLRGKPARKLQPAADKEIVEEIFRFRNLAHGGDLMPALLVGWACLEASARRLIEDKVAKPQSPARVIDQLAETGALDVMSANEVRALIDLRNRYIHGDFSARVSLMQLLALDDALMLLNPTVKPSEPFHRLRRI